MKIHSKDLLTGNMHIMFYWNLKRVLAWISAFMLRAYNFLKRDWGKNKLFSMKSRKDIRTFLEQTEIELVVRFVLDKSILIKSIDCVKEKYHFTYIT